MIEACKTRPDFFYADGQAAVYIDGPPHDYPERQARDATQTECLEDRGYLVIRFGRRDDWATTIVRYRGQAYKWFETWARGWRDFVYRWKPFSDVEVEGTAVLRWFIYRQIASEIDNALDRLFTVHEVNRSRRFRVKD